MFSFATVMFWWRPDGHGSGAAAPASQYEPAKHSRHAVSPDAFWYLPATHSMHEPCPDNGCTVPGPHSVGSVAASGHAKPSSQAVQLDCATSPGALPKEPAGHAAALALTEPASQ